LLELDVINGSELTWTSRLLWESKSWYLRNKRCW